MLQIGGWRVLIADPQNQADSDSFTPVSTIRETGRAEACHVRFSWIHAHLYAKPEGKVHDSCAHDRPRCPCRRLWSRRDGKEVLTLFLGLPIAYYYVHAKALLECCRIP